MKSYEELMVENLELLRDNPRKFFAELKKIFIEIREKVLKEHGLPEDFVFDNNIYIGTLADTREVIIFRGDMLPPTAKTVELELGKAMMYN